MALQTMFMPTGEWWPAHGMHESPTELLQLAASLARHSVHPFSRAVVLLQTDATAWLPMQTVQEQVGQGLSGCVLNTQGEVTRELRLGSLAFCQAWHNNCLVPVNAGGAQVHLCDGQGWLASFAFHERLRVDAVQGLQALQAQGLRLFMLSGDKSAAVERIAHDLRLPSAQVQAHCSPEAKLQFVQNLQAQGRHVAMVGDGFNDMPVLAGAHVSFAFGQAVPLAQARSDVVVQGHQLMAIANTIALAKRTQTVVRHNLTWAALYNAVCVPLAFMGYLPPWLAGLGMALSSVIVVLYSLQLALPMRLTIFEPQQA
jgi:Cu2+-exporting ATPase